MASEKPAIATCYIHRGNPVDTRLLHEHHVDPQGMGGADTPENKIWLCASCHDAVHRLSHLIKGGKSGVANDIAVQYLPNSPAARERLKTLATKVSRAMADFDPDYDDENTAPVIVQLHLPRKLHSQLKTLAASHSNKKSKKRVGLYNYITNVLVNHARVAINTPGRAKSPEVRFGVAEEDQDSSIQKSDEPLLTDLP